MKPHVWTSQDRMVVYKLDAREGAWHADRSVPFLYAGSYPTWRQAYDAAYEAMYG